MIAAAGEGSLGNIVFILDVHVSNLTSKDILVLSIRLYDIQLYKF